MAISPHICPTHPDAPAITYPAEVVAHMREHDHGTATADTVWRSLVRVPDVEQVRAALRIFACRRCATMVETYDPERPPYCDTHLPEPPT